MNEMNKNHITPKTTAFLLTDFLMKSIGDPKRNQERIQV